MYVRSLILFVVPVLLFANVHQRNYLRGFAMCYELLPIPPVGLSNFGGPKVAARSSAKHQ